MLTPPRLWIPATQEPIEISSTCKIFSTKAKPMEIEEMWRTEKEKLAKENRNKEEKAEQGDMYQLRGPRKGDSGEGEYHQLVTEYPSCEQVRWRRNHNDSTEPYEEMNKEGFETGRDEIMRKETCNRPEHVDKRMKGLGRDMNHMHQIENEVVKTGGADVGEEIIQEGTGKETIVKGVGDLTLSSGLEPAMERTNGGTAKRHNEEPTTDQGKDGGAKKNVRIMSKTDYGATR